MIQTTRHFLHNRMILIVIVLCASAGIGSVLGTSPANAAPVSAHGFSKQSRAQIPQYATAPLYVYKGYPGSKMCVQAPIVGNETYLDPCSGGGQQQVWSFEPYSGSWFRMVNSATGACLGLQNGSTSWGLATITWACNSNTDQQWKFVYDGFSYNNITFNELVNNKATAANGGNNVCLGTDSGAIYNGVPTIIWGCNNNQDQEWSYT